MPKFTVVGVDRESKLDTELVIEAATPANAKAKAELDGIVVTEVMDFVSSPAPVAPGERALFVSAQPEPVRHISANQTAAAASKPADSTTIAFGVTRGILLAIGIIVLLFLLLVFLGGR